MRTNCFYVVFYTSSSTCLHPFWSFLVVYPSSRCYRFDVPISDYSYQRDLLYFNNIPEQLNS